eukprot:jgi/Tetstr1/437582/TSEL_026254.t1
MRQTADYKGTLPVPPARVGNAGELGVDVPQHERVRIHVTVPLEDNGSTGRKLDGVPSELLVMRRRATIGDLKKAAAAAFTANYKVFERFEPREMQGIHGEAQSDRVRLTNIPDETHVLLCGRGLEAAENSVWRHTGGGEDWLVDCKCGTIDDDGARMISCDACQVWMHTRCNGIPDRVYVGVT